MVVPLGSPTGGSSLVGTFLVNNVVGPRKWLGQPELAIAQRSSWVVLVGNKKLEEKLCSSEELELIVPCLNQVGLLTVRTFLVSILVD